MKRNLSLNVVFTPKHDSDDLARLASQWDVGVTVTVTNPVNIVKGEAKISSVKKAFSKIHRQTGYRGEAAH